MCNLQTHMDRDHRIVEAQRLEPVYTKLAAEYGIEYEPPTATAKTPEEAYLLSADSSAAEAHPAYATTKDTTA